VTFDLKFSAALKNDLITPLFYVFCQFILHYPKMCIIGTFKPPDRSIKGAPFLLGAAVRRWRDNQWGRVCVL